MTTDLNTERYEFYRQTTREENCGAVIICKLCGTRCLGTHELEHTPGCLFPKLLASLSFVAVAAEEDILSTQLKTWLGPTQLGVGGVEGWTFSRIYSVVRKALVQSSLPSASPQGDENAISEDEAKRLLKTESVGNDYNGVWMTVDAAVRVVQRVSRIVAPEHIKAQGERP